VLGAVAAGSTYAQAASISGVSQRTVCRLVSDHGVVIRATKTRASDLSIEEREAVFEGIIEKETNAVIARRIDRSRGTVGREIDRNGGPGPR
jgi:hypothetical protein